MLHSGSSQQHRTDLPPLVIIAGPTASGKSAAAVEIARRLRGSVISADSMQVYRGMDIGSAKVTIQEMQGIPHYLIDIVDPMEEWNVVRFQQMARAAVTDILSQDRLPILCGGTGFYIQALLYNIDFTETTRDTTYRRMLQQRAEEEGPEILYEELRQIDPASAAAWHPNNIKRTIRALEFYHDTGERISEHNEAQGQRPAAYHTVFDVLSMDRARLYERIDARVDRMIEQGLVAEVEMLRAQGLTQTDVSMQGLGYRQILDALDGTITMEEAIARIKIETRHFAKRQLTWFKREPYVTWIDVDSYPSQEAMWDDMTEQIQGELQWNP